MPPQGQPDLLTVTDGYPRTPELTEVKVHIIKENSNPYTNSDAVNDDFIYAFGPHFVSIVLYDPPHGLGIKLTPAPLTDNLVRQMECRQKYWSKLRKWLQCPLL